VVLRYLKFFVSVGAARTAGLLISAATFPFLVRMLGVESFGRWSYVLAVVGFFDLAVNTGLIAHASREVAVQRLGANPFVSEVFTYSASWGLYS
jgi:O-antigen/teichoic acid export membrane protein